MEYNRIERLVCRYVRYYNKRQVKVVDPTLYAASKGISNVFPNERFFAEYNYVYFEFADIAAAELADFKALTIGGHTYYSSALNYAKAVLLSAKSLPDEKALAKTMYWYYMAAKAFFG